MQKMKLLLCVMIFCFWLYLVKADDLQESLLNRNNREAGVYSHASQIFRGVYAAVSDGDARCKATLAKVSNSYNCAFQCTQDSDCKYRLGPMRSKINTVPNPDFDSHSGIGQYTQQIQIYSNIIALPGVTDAGDFSNGDGCSDFYDETRILDPVNYPFPGPFGVKNFDGSAQLTDECFTADLTNSFHTNSQIQGENYLLQTVVDYPDMRCLSGQCVRFKDAYPGYGQEYCLPTYGTANQRANTCPTQGLSCRSNSLAGNGISFTPIQSMWQEIDPYNNGDILHHFYLVMENRAKGAEFPPVTDANGYPPALYYSTDPRDSLGICGCTLDSDCGVPGMKCLPGDTYRVDAAILDTTHTATSFTPGRCYCTSSSQCTGRGGGTQQCITNSLVQTGKGNVGSCSCVVGAEDSCNYSGRCVSLQEAWPNTYIQSYYTIEQYALGVNKQPTQPGRCECYGKHPLGASWNDTVTGAACEEDSFSEIYCSGHGRPICPLINGAVPAYSLNNGGLIGSYCPNSTDPKGDNWFAQRGQVPATGICVCQKFWGPDQGTAANAPCSVPIRCSSSGSSVLVNGFCECTADTFQAQDFSSRYKQFQSFFTTALTPEQYHTFDGACIDGCSYYKASGNGECIFNPQMVLKELSNTISYNNDAVCITGWKTLYNPNDPNNPPYYDFCYLCTPGSPHIAESTIMLGAPVPLRLQLDGPGQNSFCNIPVSPIGKICGEGDWTPVGCRCTILNCTFDQATSQWISPVGYKCVLGTYLDVYGVSQSIVNVTDWGGNPIVLYQPVAPGSYCASTCLTLTGNMTDPSTANDYNNVQAKQCGGPLRGSCVDNGIGGTACVCKNGYKGLVCQTAICPRSRGKMCGGNGSCDESTGFCVCNIGFSGSSCQYKVNDCGSSQSLLSLPLPDPSAVDF